MSMSVAIHNHTYMVYIYLVFSDSFSRSIWVGQNVLVKKNKVYCAKCGIILWEVGRDENSSYDFYLVFRVNYRLFELSGLNPPEFFGF
jgi:hypothetical protein